MLLHRPGSRVLRIVADCLLKDLNRFQYRNKGLVTYDCCVLGIWKG